MPFDRLFISGALAGAIILTVSPGLNAGAFTVVDMESLI